MLVTSPPNVVELTLKMFKPGTTPPTDAGAVTANDNGDDKRKRSPIGNEALVVNPCVKAETCSGGQEGCVWQTGHETEQGKPVGKPPANPSNKPAPASARSPARSIRLTI